MTKTPISSSIGGSYTKTTFSDTYLGLILQLLLFAILMVVAAIAVPVFFNPMNCVNLIRLSVPYLIMALALALSARVKGIDLSAGAVFAAASWVFAHFASENMAVPGLIIALAIGLAVGSVNGTANMFIRIPSAVLTMIVSAAVTFGVSLLIGSGAKGFWDGRPVVAESLGMDVTVAGLISFLTALALVLGLLYFTRLGGEGQIQKRLVFTAYAASGLLFSMAACYLVMRLHMGSPMLGESGSALYLLFIAGAIYINRSARIRFIPVICALLAALNWSLISNICSLINLSSFYSFVLQCILTAAILTPAFMVQRGSRSRT